MLRTPWTTAQLWKPAAPLNIISVNTAFGKRRYKQHQSSVTCAQAIKARWLIDIRYGVKMDAVALLQEWVADIGAQAGLTPFNTMINSGAIGVPESRLELEVAFDSMAELDAFWSAIPPERHRAWSQRAQHVIIDGSPQWEVYRTVPPRGSSAESSAESAEQPSLGQKPKFVRRQAAFDAAQSSAAAGDVVTQQADADDAAEWTGPVDWKGDPMKINPGDKLPFF